MADLSALKVTDLKAELKKRGLAVGGLKKELVERLQAALKAEEEEQQQEEEKEESQAADEDKQEAEEDAEPEKEGEKSAEEQKPAIPEVLKDANNTALTANATPPTDVLPHAGEEIPKTSQPATPSPIEAIDPAKDTVEEAVEEQAEIRAAPAQTEQTERKVEKEGNDDENNAPEPESMETDTMEQQPTLARKPKAEDTKMEDMHEKSDKEEGTKDVTNTGEPTNNATAAEQSLPDSVIPPEELPVPPDTVELAPLAVDAMDTSPDIAADLKKRKRRSASPPPPSAAPPSEDTHEEPSPKKSRQDTTTDEQPPSPILTRRHRESVSKPADIRFKSLVGTDATATAEAAAATTTGNLGEEEEDEVYSTPALHPATPALYIRDLMRPLKPPALRAHLLNLATKATDLTQVEDVIKTFYTDPLKTHAFVVFESTYYATRVRVALNGRKFPVNEKGRKPLWVDFIPEEVVVKWISEEEDGSSGSGPRGGGRGMVRWNVVYETDPDGTVRVWHEEEGTNNGSARNASNSGSGRPPPPSLEARISSARPGGTVEDDPEKPPRSPSPVSPQSARRLPPDMPRADRDRLAAQQAAAAAQTSISNNQPYSSNNPIPTHHRPSTSKNFQTIDQLFLSTTTKPKLYYLPVPEHVAKRRLQEMEEKEKLVGTDGIRDPRERPGAPNWGGSGKPRRGRDTRGGPSSGVRGPGGRGGDYYVPADSARVGRDRERERDRSRSRVRGGRSRSPYGRR